MAQVPWFVVAVWPTREAYAPITRASDNFVWILFAVILLVAPLALWRFRRLMAPLQTLGLQIQERYLGTRPTPVEVAGGREIRREEQRLSWETTHDSLTQLLNRRAFTATLVKLLGEAARHEKPSVLMLIDLDHFKPVNDQGGHLLGDDLLRRLADLFRDSVRHSDTVARLGGDEFGVILPSCGLEPAENLAEKIRAGVEQEQDNPRRQCLRDQGQFHWQKSVSLSRGVRQRASVASCTSAT